MKAIAFATAVVLAPANALAWGQEGHSIIAEVAQHRLTQTRPEIMTKIAGILGPGVSLASIASWADTYRDDAPETYNWHFVDIPINVGSYDAAKYCARTEKGDCIIAELERLKNDVRCKKDEEQKKALMFAVHLVGDVHQPLHTVLEEQGGNTIDVLAFMHGARCKRDCRMSPIGTNLHAAWDSTLIQMTTWDWGSYVTRLEAGWLKSPAARRSGIDAVDLVKWAEETHKVAHDVWHGHHRTVFSMSNTTKRLCRSSISNSVSRRCGSRGF
jgi:S1/P1 Nuclease